MKNNCMIYIYKFLAIMIGLILSLQNIALANIRFKSAYPCTDFQKVCVDSGKKLINGLSVYRSCWKWKYVKKCDYPSTDDCKLYDHCYPIGNLQGKCLLKDSNNICVNTEREFSCKIWESFNKENKSVKTDLKEYDGVERFVCTGFPCFDGNCADKSFENNGEIMESIAQLSMLSKMSPGMDQNFNLFAGQSMHCTKKMSGSSNCCRSNPKGWLHNIGAKCSNGEKILAQRKRENLCVYLGKIKHKKLGIVTLVKHYYCCWGNMLDKVIQVQGRNQLGIGFGTAEKPECRGLTLEEMTGQDKDGNILEGRGIDFGEVDFSEFINDFKVKNFDNLNSPPKVNDVSSRMKMQKSNFRKGKVNQNDEVIIHPKIQENYQTKVVNEDWFDNEDERDQDEIIIEEDKAKGWQNEAEQLLKDYDPYDTRNKEGGYVPK